MSRTLWIVTGPDLAGKSSFIEEFAQPNIENGNKHLVAYDFRDMGSNNFALQSIKSGKDVVIEVGRLPGDTTGEATADLANQFIGQVKNVPGLEETKIGVVHLAPSPESGAFERWAIEQPGVASIRQYDAMKNTADAIGQKMLEQADRGWVLEHAYAARHEALGVVIDQELNVLQKTNNPAMEWISHLVPENRSAASELSQTTLSELSLSGVRGVSSSAISEPGRDYVGSVVGQNSQYTAVLDCSQQLSLHRNATLLQQGKDLPVVGEAVEINYGLNPLQLMLQRSPERSPPGLSI